MYRSESSFQWKLPQTSLAVAGQRLHAKPQTAQLLLEAPCLKRSISTSREKRIIKITVITVNCVYIHRLLRHDRALQRDAPRRLTTLWHWPLRHDRALQRHLLGGSPHWAQVQNERCTFKQLQTSSASCAHVTDFVLSTKLRCTRRCVTTACRWHPTCTVTRSVTLLKFRAYRREIQAFSSN